MTTVFNVLMLLCLISIPTLHVLSAFVRSVSHILSPISLGANILALLPLLYFGAELRTVFMLYMISLAVRQISFALSAYLNRKRGDKGVL